METLKEPLQLKIKTLYSFNPNTFSPEFFVDKNILPLEFNKDGERLNILTEVKTNSAKEQDVLNKGKLYFKPVFKPITLDIETYLESSIVNNKTVKTHKILAVCFFDGKNSYKFFRNNSFYIKMLVFIKY